MKTRNIIAILLMLPGLMGLTGCATGHTKEILWGMAAGAVVGAAVGNQFVHHGEFKQYQQQNTAATAVLAAIGTGAVMSWHYNALQEREVEISGRYARTRLCDPAQLDQQLVKQLSGSNDTEVMPLQKDQVGKLAISLDDETKWAYPSFQKRYLQPERGETQVLSSRYIWEIVRPGTFVTRSQNPDFFVEPKLEAPKHEAPKAETSKKEEAKGKNEGN